MAKYAVDTRIKYNLDHSNPAVLQATEDVKNYYKSKYGYRYNDSLFALLKSLPNPMIHKMFEPTNPDMDTWLDCNVAILPIMKEISTNKNGVVDVELFKKYRDEYRIEFNEHRSKVKKQLDFTSALKREYDAYLSKDTKEALNYLKLELLNPNKSFVESALTHNEVIDMKNPHFYSLIKNNVQEDIELLKRVGVERWKQESKVLDFLNTLNKTGMVAEYLTSYINGGNLGASPSNMYEISSRIQSAYNPNVKLDDKESFTTKYEGVDYDLTNRRQYLDFVEQYNNNHDQRSQSELALQNIDLALLSERGGM